MASLISVIIPTYNAEQFIGQAIQSVLDQSYPPQEIIVIDDGSTDNTKKALLPFMERIIYLAQNNLGPSAARNSGIRAAKGNLICFQDADDFWTPDKLEVQLAFMEANPEIAMVFSDHEEFNEAGIVLSSYLGEKWKAFEVIPTVSGLIENAFGKLVVENFISTPTVMLRKSCLDTAGLFDEEIWSVEDRDLWMRISASFSIACIPRIFCKRRYHQTNISKQKELTLIGRIRVLEKNWALFPELVPGLIWRRELADYYYSLGCALLPKGERWGVFQAVGKSLSFEVALLLRDRSLSIRYLLREVALVCAALLGWKISRFIWRPLKKTFRFAI